MSNPFKTALFIASLAPLLIAASYVDEHVQKNEEYPLPKLPIEGTRDPSSLKVAAPTGPRIEERKVTRPANKKLVVRFPKLTAGSSNIGWVVETISNEAKQHPIEMIHIVGHTDSDQILGKAKLKYANNAALSAARAEIVATKLRERGIAIPLSYEGKGESEPIATNTTADGRALNRRTEVLIFYGAPRKVAGVGNMLSQIRCRYGEAPKPAPVVAKKAAPKREVAENKRRDKPDAMLVLNFATLFSTLDAGMLTRLRAFINETSKKGIIDSVHFVGHTDSDKIRGKALKKFRDNYELSKSRARMVADLFSKSFPDIQTTFDGHGPDEPVAPNTSRAGKAKNRRTELRVYYVRQQAERKLASEDDGGQKDACAEGKCEPPAPPSATAEPFRVTLDGVPLQAKDYHETTPSNHVDFQRCTDVALESAEIQVHFDRIAAKKVLELTISRDLIASGEKAMMRVYTNYRAFLKRAEIRVFKKSAAPRAEPLSILPLERKGEDFADFMFAPEVLRDQEFGMVLRVYDDKNHFDETAVKTLVVRAGKPAAGAPLPPPRLNGGWGENSLKVSNIPVGGGTITVNGTDIPDSHTVTVMGSEIPVDGTGKFAVQQILPAGKNYGIQVVVRNGTGEGLEFQRDLHIPENDWFLVGIADLIIGGNSSKGPASLVTQDVDHFDKKVFVDGRLAFYLKGKIKGEYLMTASADTREGPVARIFSNFLDKDPAELFRRLDPDKYYPVYGDDSTLVEDAPTQGKFYVKIERDSSYIMWGNFRSRITDTELAKIDRGLYGLNLRWETEKNVALGERERTLDVFAATPGTLQAREEYRGTGSSHIWLRHPDLSIGSERVRVEVRDKDSGLVLSSKTLNANDDYTVNNLQGHITLRAPLPSYADNSELVHSNNLSGHPVFLVVNYEYTPGFTEPSTLALGGRVTQWVGNSVKIGVTGGKQNEPGRNQVLAGADALVKLGSRTQVKAEVTQTDGPGVDEQSSLDGGYAFTAIPRNPGTTKARAFKVEGSAGLYETDSKSGTVTAYVKQKQAGFSAPGELTLFQTEQLGGTAELPLVGGVTLGGKHDQKREANWMRTLASSANLGVMLDKHWGVDGELRHDERIDLSGGTSAFGSFFDFGERNDLAAKLSYTTGDRWDAYGFGQHTLSKSVSRLMNDRAGAGGHLRLTDDLTAGGELSGGNLGLGAKAETKYKLDEHHDIYLSYLLDTDRTDTGYREHSGSTGNLVSGTRGRYDDTTSVYYENRYLTGAQPSGITHTFGLDLSPLQKWTVGFSAEKGTLISTDGFTRNERTAGTVSLGYGTATTKVGTSLEVRKEEGSGLVRNTYLTRNQLSSKLDREWRMQAKVNLLRSHSSQGDFYDGDWTEGSLGVAYRPIDNDRLNMLFKYQFLELLPSPGQIDVNGSTPDYRQRSNVLSIDAIYDITRLFSLGAKYAFALRSLRDGRDNSASWYQSNAHLGILRVDFHVIHGWDALVEWRNLYLLQAKDLRSGWLIALYKELVEDGTLKIGVGFNFTDYSDNLTDLSYRNRGWFINVVGGL